jgi:hypothetical protein
MSEILETEFGQDIELIDPDGVTYTDLKGNVIRDTVEYDDRGIEIITHKPIVQLRMRSLSRIPKENERWLCRITDIVSGDRSTYFVEKASLDGRSAGYIELNLSKTVQS